MTAVLIYLLAVLYLAGLVLMAELDHLAVSVGIMREDRPVQVAMIILWPATAVALSMKRLLRAR